MSPIDSSRCVFLLKFIYASLSSFTPTWPPTTTTSFPHASLSPRLSPQVLSPASPALCACLCLCLCACVSVQACLLVKRSSKASPQSHASNSNRAFLSLRPSEQEGRPERCGILHWWENLFSSYSMLCYKIARMHWDSFFLSVSQWVCRQIYWVTVKPLVINFTS